MCRALKEANHENQSDIATTDYGLDALWLDYVRSRVPDDTRLRIFPQGKWLDKGWSLSLVRWLWATAREYDVIHIHALFSSTSSASAFVAMRRNVPYIIEPHGTLSPYTFANRRRYLKRIYFSLLDRRTALKAAAIHYTTSQEARKAERLDLATRAVVIPVPCGAQVAERRQSSSSDTVLFLSRLHPVKGVELLLEAMVAVRGVVSSAKIIIAGSGDSRYEKSLRDKVRKLNLDTAVSFVGFVEGERKAETFRQACIFVLPSYQENFGLAIAEALAYGIPVVITQGVDLAEDVIAYGSGCVVQRDVKELAEALLALLGDPLRRAAMGENGRRQVMELYSTSKVGAQLDGLYRSVLWSRAGQ
jgi:glycosyltransferase involved in cell wall biosynthesis